MVDIDHTPTAIQSGLKKLYQIVRNNVHLYTFFNVRYNIFFHTKHPATCQTPSISLPDIPSSQLLAPYHADVDQRLENPVISQEKTNQSTQHIHLIY